MNNFVRVENVDFDAAIAAGFSHYRENGSFFEFFYCWEDIPGDAVELS